MPAEIREKTVTVETPYSDEEIKEYTEKVMKNDTEIMREQNNHLEAFLSRIGELKVDFFPYTLNEQGLDLELIDDMELLLDLHNEIHRYIKYLESIIGYADGTRDLGSWGAKREMEALRKNHFRVSMRMRELRALGYDDND